jgi:hypothetical protein
VVLLFSCFGTSLADVATQAWVRRFSNVADSTDQPKKLVTDTNGNVYVVGNTDDGLVGQDWLIMKYSSAGLPLWTNRYNSPDNSRDTATAAAIDGGGALIVSGIAGTNYPTIKYSSNGVPVWTNFSKISAAAIATDISGNVIVTGSSLYGSTSAYGTIKYASNGAPVWTNIYQGAFGGDYALANAVDGSGNVIVTGNSNTGGGTNDFVTLKYSSAGATVWTKSFNGTGNSYDSPIGVAVDVSGNAYVTGSSYNGSNYDFATIRYNSAVGSVSWTRTYGGATNSTDVPAGIVVDGSANVFVTGYSQTGTNAALITIKYSSAGTALWTNRYNSAANLSDLASAIALDTNGNVFVTGSSTPSNSVSDFLTIKYSTAGAVLWTNRYHGLAGNSDSAVSIAVDNPGNVFVTGSSSANGGTVDIATIKYSNAGGGIWTNRYTGPANGTDQAAALALDASGNLYVTGNSQNSAASDIATIKYSGDGTALWTNFFNGPANSYDQGVALAVDNAGSVFVAGDVFNGTNYHFATLKYSGAGLLVWSNFYNGPANSNDFAQAAATDGTNVFVTGSSYGNLTNTDYATIKYSGAGVPLWTNRFDSGGNDQPQAIAVDAAGNVFVTGLPATVKYSNTGTPLWTNLAGLSPVAMALDGAGNIVVVGTSPSLQLITLKYSNAGLPLWTNAYNGPTNIFGIPADSAQAVTIDRSGNIFVTGHSDPYRFGVSLSFLTLGYSSAGIPLWTNQSVAGNSYAIAVDAGGNVFVSGNSANVSGNTDYTTIGYSNSGVPLWTNRYNGPADGDEVIPSKYCLAAGTDGAVYVTGASDGNFSSEPVWGRTYDFATVKYVYGLAPVVTTLPAGRTNFVGTTATFGVTAAGSTPLQYQWSRSGTNLSNGGNLSGATTNMLTVANVVLADAASYSVVVTNAYGSATSSVALLSVPPISAVLPLPAFAGPSFLVGWSGQAAANAGLTFGIYVSTNNSTFTLWKTLTSATNAFYRGIPGQTYYFYSVAHDSAGLQESVPPSGDAQTSVPVNAPVLAPIANATNNPGQNLIFTNSIMSGAPVGSYVFSLDAGSPAGAAVTASNGVFNWTPNCSQASSVNLITVRVTDSGQTNLSDALSFVATVKECVSPQLGRLVLAVGDTGRVPINLITSVPLTNLTMRLLLPEGHLTQPSLQPIVSEICASGVQFITNGQYLLSFATCANQSLIGTQQVAWLNFTASSNQSSAFVPLNLDQITGHQPNGSAVANFAPQAGRVVIVGVEPLLEAVADPSRQVIITLYAAVNSTNDLTTAAGLSAPISWLPWQQVVMTNLFSDFPVAAPTNALQFFRALRE